LFHFSANLLQLRRTENAGVDKKLSATNCTREPTNAQTSLSTVTMVARGVRSKQTLLSQLHQGFERHREQSWQEVKTFVVRNDCLFGAVRRRDLLHMET